MSGYSEIITHTIKDRILGCWLGKAVGGTLGMPYEGVEGPLDLDFYRPIPTHMIPNDDLDLQILWACLLDSMDKPLVGPNLFEAGWKEHVDFPWDEYGVCKRNLSLGIPPPRSGAFDNWFANGMGAAIRSEIWACLAPGDPERAAAYAELDASLDHSGEGIDAEVFFAAMESYAFVSASVSEIVQKGLEFIPGNSEIRSAIEDVYSWWEASGEWMEVRTRILQKYGHENFTNVTENIAFTVLGLLDGGGDFGRSICTAANCGKDTDCTAATVGAILGILNPQSIGDRWLKPIGKDLVLSPEITGISPPDTLDEFTELILRLGRKLEGEKPVIPIDESSFDLSREEDVVAEVGWSDVPWFGHGWEFSSELNLKLPKKMDRTSFRGTWASFDCPENTPEGFFLRFYFELEAPLSARVFFNTPLNCRVFLDEKFAFGREGGRMAPSPHRIPMGQAIDSYLPAGRHTITAVIQRTRGLEKMEWVVGVADCEANLQLVPGIFVEP